MDEQNLLLSEDGYPNAPAEQKPALRLSAYYYDFDATGVYAVDLVLSAVAMAGKSAHHTDLWDESAGSRDGVDGDTPVEWIQSAAQKAAAHIEQLERELSAKDHRIAHLTNPQFIRHRGNGVSLNCRRSTIDLFVSRAIENKDKPEPTQEEVAAFWNEIDADMKDKP